METASDYYVYVYIDPRNFEEFYYGKGNGNRKNAHLYDDTDSEKSRRIKAITKEGLKDRLMHHGPQLKKEKEIV